MKDSALFAGREWISASGFHEVSELEVLRRVSAKVSGLKKTAPGSKPLVLLDLDSTLYEVAPRTLQILGEWAKSSQSVSFPVARAAIQKMKVSDVGYSVRETFVANGLNLEKSENRAAWESAKAFWSGRFFSSAYLIYDHPYPGAADFARELHHLGAEIVYLTGRDEPGMGEGTRANLLRDGFPWGVERTHLLLKKSPQILDIDHKTGAEVYIRANGTLIASFENEPKNLIALHSLFPDAMHVFVDTIYSDHETPAGNGLYRIRGFQIQSI